MIASAVPVSSVGDESFMMAVLCSKCQMPLPAKALNTENVIPCPSCGVSLQVEAFPALLEEEHAVRMDSAPLDREASCFFHPQRKAVIPCDGCGRFLCHLCDLPIDNRHICPRCLEMNRRNRSIRNLENSRILYDQLALYLAILPAFFFLWPTIITAPIVIYLVIRYWKAPAGLVRRTRIVFVAAFTVAVVELAGWTAFFIAVLA
jgi:hypothetical protein